MTLNDDFDELEQSLERLIALLAEADERFWSRYLRRARVQVQAHRLAGVTAVLGCFGGTDTLSDLRLDSPGLAPLARDNLNARLTELRTRTFRAADAIASRRSW